jgi:hypothetical protein
MDGVADLRVARDDHEVAAREQRAAARKRGTLHARDHGNVEVAKRSDGVAERREEHLDTLRLFSAAREIESCAERRTVAGEHERIAAGRGRGLSDRFDQGRKRACIQRVAPRGVAELDSRDAPSDGVTRSRGLRGLGLRGLGLRGVGRYVARSHFCSAESVLGT